MYRACVGKRVRHVRFVRSVRCARCARCVRHVRIVRPSVARVCVRAPVRNKKTEPKERAERERENPRAEAQPPPTQTPTQTKPKPSKPQAVRPVKDPPKLWLCSSSDPVNFDRIKPSDTEKINPAKSRKVPSSRATLRTSKQPLRENSSRKGEKWKP
jgi:hypothetical protein